MEEIKETLSDNKSEIISSKNIDYKKPVKSCRRVIKNCSKKHVIDSETSSLSLSRKEKSEPDSRDRGSSIDSNNSKKTNQYYEENVNNDNREDKIRYYEFEIK
jgi:hypothetical protein